MSPEPIRDYVGEALAQSANGKAAGFDVDNGNDDAMSSRNKTSFKAERRRLAALGPSWSGGAAMNEWEEWEQQETEEQVALWEEADRKKAKPKGKAPVVSLQSGVRTRHTRTKTV